MNRSKRIEFSPPEGGQPLPRPGGKGGARRNPEAGFDSWVGRNLCRRNLPGSGFVVPLPGLKGASACFSRKPEGILCRTFRPPRLSARTALAPGPQHKWEHENFPEMSNFISPPAEPGVYQNEIKSEGGQGHHSTNWAPESELREIRLCLSPWPIGFRRSVGWLNSEFCVRFFHLG